MAKKEIAFCGTGRRKKSIARVRLIDGNGKINVMDLVNEVELVMSNSDKATSRNDLNPIEFSDSEEVGLTPQ